MAVQESITCLSVHCQLDRVCETLANVSCEFDRNDAVLRCKSASITCEIFFEILLGV